jgi:EmrB/QacA subfamily drug resistance transporter
MVKNALGATRAQWLVLVAMTGSLSMIMLDQTVVTVALPSMTRDLHLSADGQQWVVNAYVLAMAALVAFGGKLGDLIGRVTTFRLGVLVFFLSSVACGVAPTESVVILARVAQGIGAALMMPATSAIMVGTFPLHQRGRAMAMYAGLSQVFLAAGPLLGGLLTEWVSWRAVFWLNVPVGIAALVMVHIAKPSNASLSKGRLSTADLALLTAGIGALVVGVQQANTWGWGSAWTLGSIVAGLVLTALFCWNQSKSRDPLLNIRLFARRPFLADSTVMGLLQFALVPVTLYTSLYGQNLLGFSPVIAGVSALPLVLPITVAAQIGGRLFDRAGVRRPVLAGLAIGTVGIVVRAVTLPTLNYWAGVPGMILMGIGLGLTISPTNTDSLNRVSAAERGQASGLVQTVRQLGGTLGLAVVGAVIAAAGPKVPSASAAHHAATAIEIGFLVTAAVVAVAWLVGWRYLARGTQSEDVDLTTATAPVAPLGVPVPSVAD